MGSRPSTIRTPRVKSRVIVVESPSKEGSDTTRGKCDNGKRNNLKSKLHSSRLVYEINDETYCLILAAEEFHEQILEHDDTIRAMSEVDTIHENTEFICELLDLRSHLHGELIRIQELLAQDDPMLENLNQYEVSNMDIIDKLKEIRDQTRFMKESLNKNESKSADGGCFIPFNGDLVEDFTGHELPTNISSQAELRELHKKEEELLCERFALLIADNQDTDEDVTKILAEHTYHVQALKIKQDIQKNKLESILNKDHKQHNKSHKQNANLKPDESERKLKGVENTKARSNHRFSIFQRDESSEDKLKGIVKSLEEMRDRNELTEESLLNILTRYNLIPRSGANAKSEQTAPRTRASIIIHDNMEIKKQLQLRRQEMKRMMDDKLKQHIHDVS